MMPSAGYLASLAAATGTARDPNASWAAAPLGASTPKAPAPALTATQINAPPLPPGIAPAPSAPVDLRGVNPAPTRSPVGVADPPQGAPPPAPPQAMAPQAEPASAQAAPDTGPPPVSPYGTSTFVPIVSGPTPGREVERRAPSVNQAKGEEMGALASLNEAATQRNETVATLGELSAYVSKEQADAALDEVKARDAERAAALDEAKSRYMKSVDDLAAKAAKMDPNDGWNKMSTAGKVASSIGSALTMMLAAGGSGRMIDFAQKSADKAIEGDFAAQKFAYEAGLDKTKAERDVYGVLLEQYGNDSAVKAAMRASTLDAIAQRLEVQKAKEKNANVRNAYDDTIAKLLQEAMQWKETGTGWVQPTGGGVSYRRIGPDGRVQPFAYSADQARAVADKESAWQQGNVTKDAEGTIDLKKEALKQRGESERVGMKKGADTEERFVPTAAGGYFARTKEEAVKEREGRAALTTALRQLDDIDSLEKGVGYSGKVAKGMGITTAEMKKLEAAQSMMLISINKGAGLGALDAGSQKILEQAIGDPKSVLGNSARRQELRKVLTEQQLGKEQAQTGARPAVAPASAVRIPK
jgi:hypothetical protein